MTNVIIANNGTTMLVSNRIYHMVFLGFIFLSAQHL